MNNRGRLNKVIDLLERRQVVFSGGMVYNGNPDDVIYIYIWPIRTTTFAS